jgi:hypothetical protein
LLLIIISLTFFGYLDVREKSVNILGEGELLSAGENYHDCGKAMHFFDGESENFVEHAEV